MDLEVSRIALVNPNLSNRVQVILIRMAQSNQIQRVTEQQLIGLLDQVRLTVADPLHYSLTFIHHEIRLKVLQEARGTRKGQ